MRIPRLYIDMSLSVGKTVTLPRDKAHHLSHVLRMHNGDVIKLFNNTGHEYDSVITTLTKKNAEVEITRSEQIKNESPLQVTLFLAIARGQHMDYSVQKAVELGVSKIIPIMSEFSNVKLQENRVQNKMTHWQNIIISATEQCGRSRLTELMTPVSFSECLDLNNSSIKLILHPGGQKNMPAIKLANNQLSLMIGPEGGFSDAEVDEAIKKETIAISLGPRILRAETAVVSAISNAQQLWGDLN